MAEGSRVAGERPLPRMVWQACDLRAPRERVPYSEPSIANAQSPHMGVSYKCSNQGPEMQDTSKSSSQRVLKPEALRALAEAEKRRVAQTSDQAVREKEINGRGGAEPVRFGDWEVKGLATDF